MEIGLNNHLKKIASELFVKYNASERRKIDASIDNIINKIDAYFEDEVHEAYLFGSYTRDTILPRKFDPFSDIDILVEFNTDSYHKLQPESYRNQLKRFAEDNYPHSLVVKDHPCIVLELNHIKFDLVPSLYDDGIFYDSIEIPSKKGGWMETEPDAFNEKLTDANTRFNSIVKPIIRLLKFWNACQGYPLCSFELETAIADMDFHKDNYESGFLYAIEELCEYDFSSRADTKIGVLQEHGDWIAEYLERGDIIKAKNRLNKILPGFLYL